VDRFFVPVVRQKRAADGRGATVEEPLGLCSKSRSETGASPFPAGRFGVWGQAAYRGAVSAWDHADGPAALEMVGFLTETDR
jgi:hypothetical protein